MIKLLLLSFLFFIPQDALPDLKHFKPYTELGGTVYLINVDNIQRKGSFITYEGLRAQGKVDESIHLNPNEWTLSIIVIDCDKKTYFYIKEYGRKQGANFSNILNTKPTTVPKGTIIEGELDVLCSEDLGLSA